MNSEEPVEGRVRLPKEGEVLGIVETRLGFGKSRVICADGKIRLCRVPGRLQRSLYVRQDNVVIVKPWDFEGDKKGDILYVYTENQVNWLKRNNYLKDLLKEEF
jgi:translation initiation factor 1A